MFRDFMNTDRIVLTSAIVADIQRAAYLPYSLRINGVQATLPILPRKLFAVRTSRMFVVCDICY
jgi:hypothetical protein